MFILTDHYTYAYAFGTDADFAGEMKETWYEALDMVTLTFPSEEPSMQELVDSGFNAEDFFGCWSTQAYRPGCTLWVTVLMTGSTRMGFIPLMAIILKARNCPARE